MTDPLQLKCGNPAIADTPVSFSRFVLPFAYRLETPPGDQNQCLYYDKIEQADEYRRIKYLTNETALVLFKRAKWFEIKKEDWEKTAWEKETITVTLKTGEFHIKMLPPTVVLFEINKQKNKVLQTGFLSVDIYFSAEQILKPTLDDLLELNELFRYFDMPYESHFAGYEKCLKNIPVDYLFDNYQTLEHKAKQGNKGKQASYFTRWLNLLKIPIYHNEQYHTLIPETWQTEAKQWIYHANIQESSKDENCLIHVDNRCYVWTAAFINGGGNALNKTFNTPPTDKLLAHNFGHWVKLLNIDRPANTARETHQYLSDFEKKWAKARTYKRWQHYGTWYGFNYHSGVMLADYVHPDLQHLGRVFREQYFDQTLLLLYLRTALFHFSRELSLIIHEQDLVDLKKIRKLREEFSRFAILYQFPSLSNQQQSIEMYTLARQCLDIDELYKEVQEEINNAHDFLEQEESNKLSNAASIFAKLAVPIGAASVIATIISNKTDIKNCLIDFKCQLLMNVLSYEIYVVLGAFFITLIPIYIYSELQERRK
jgi:hypothetical protein